MSSSEPTARPPNDEVQAAFVRFLGDVLKDRQEGRVQSIESYRAMHPKITDREFSETLALLRSTSHPTLEQPTGSPQELGVGSSLGPYDLLSPIGQGGQATVYLAHDRRLPRKVALKVVDGNAAGFERFQREAEILARLDLPGVCPIIDFGIEGNRGWIAMRYLPGETLSRRIAQRADRANDWKIAAPSTLTTKIDSSSGVKESQAETESDPGRVSLPAGEEIREILRIFESIARTLDSCHNAGILHRDIKPANLMITDAGDPVILDFGLAGFEAPSGDCLTGTGAIFGTPAYMAPEQIESHGVPPDRRADVYSLGVALYEAVTLSRPFSANSRQELFFAVLQQSPVPPRRLNPSVGADLNLVILHCLEKVRGDRYPTAKELALDLAAVSSGSPISIRSTNLFGRAWKWARREPALTALILSLLVLLPFAGALTTKTLADADRVAAAEEMERLEVRDDLLSEAFAAAEAGSEGEAEEILERLGRGFEGDLEVVTASVLVWIELNRFDRARAALERHRRILEGHGSFELLVSRLESRPRLETALSSAMNSAGNDVALLSVISHLLCDLASWEPKKKAERTHARALDAALQAVVSADRPRFHLLSRLARTAALAGNKALAPSIARRLSSEWPDRISAIKWAEFAYMSVKETPEWIRSAERLVELAPGVARHWNNLAFAYEAVGSRELADRALHKALEIDPKYAHALNGLSVSEARRGRWDEAIQLAQRALAAEPRLKDAHQNLVIALRRAGRLEDSVKAGEHALEFLKPHLDVDLFHVLAGSLMELDRIDETIQVYRIGLEIDPESVEVLYGLGIVLQERGGFAEAVEVLERADSIDPDRIEVLNPLAKAYEAVGKLNKAEDVLRRALIHHPDSVNAWNELGIVCHKLGKLDEAELALRRALELDPKTVGPYVNLGLIAETRGKFDDALQLLENALRSDPDSTAVRFNRAVLLNDLGDPHGALRDARQVAEARPNGALERALYAKLLAEVGMFPEALKEIERSNELFEGKNPEIPTAVEVAENLAMKEAAVMKVREEVGDDEAFLERLRVNWNSLNALCRLGRFDLAAHLAMRGLEVGLPEMTLKEEIRFRTLAAEAALRLALQKPPMEETERGRGGPRFWREAALGWLESGRAEVDRRFRNAEISEAGAVALLRPWLTNPAFDAARSLSTDADLEESERSAFAALWRRLEDWSIAARPRVRVSGGARK